MMFVSTCVTKWKTPKDSTRIATADRMNAKEKNTSPPAINGYFGANYAVKGMLYGPRIDDSV